LELRANQPFVADCDSRNGTRLNGLRIGAALALPDSGTIGLGDDSDIAFSQHQGTLRLEVRRGLDQGALAVVSLAPVCLDAVLANAPDLQLGFSRGRPTARCAGRLSLNGAAVAGEVQLVKGDVVSVGDRSMRVVA
jgi:hypothetical protein